MLCMVFLERLFVVFYTSKNKSRFVTTVNAERKKCCAILISFNTMQTAHYSLVIKILYELTHRYWGKIEYYKYDIQTIHSTQYSGTVKLHMDYVETAKGYSNCCTIILSCFLPHIWHTCNKIWNLWPTIRDVCADVRYSTGMITMPVCH